VQVVSTALSILFSFAPSAKRFARFRSYKRHNTHFCFMQEIADYSGSGPSAAGRGLADRAAEARTCYAARDPAIRNPARFSAALSRKTPTASQMRGVGGPKVDVSCVSTRPASGWSSQPGWKTAVRLQVIVAVAALALAGCNANQAINPSSQPASQVFAGHDVDYNPYDPISYAQNNTGRGGGGGK
jgi:hypothetical protein